MPRASKKLLQNSVWEQIHSTLVEVISSFDEYKLSDFLSEFLTKEEKTMTSKRLALYIMLLSGYSDWQIEDVLKVSNETIRTTRTTLGYKSEKFKENLSGWIKPPKKTKGTNRLIKMIELALVAKGDMKARAKLASGNY
ncbi:hypothetical protein HYW39_01885 [Candidatus Curtissbacteria bacterium]|nr:hypothetical protein [Candidatus Curtissbacteria bacterium]